MFCNSVTSLVTMLATMRWHLRSLLEFTNCNSKRNFHSMNARLSELNHSVVDVCSWKDLAALLTLSTLAVKSWSALTAKHHITHLTVLKHMNPIQPNKIIMTRLDLSMQFTLRFVHILFCMYFIEYFWRNICLPNERNFINKFKLKLLLHPSCSFFLTWRFGGLQLISWLIMWKATRRQVKTYVSK